MNVQSKLTYSLICATLYLSTIFAQKLDPQDIAYNELREIVETASRANKKVWLEDFTGINWTYCPNASFAIDSLIQDFPDILNTVEWHSPSFTPDSIDYCYVGCGIPSEELGDDQEGDIAAANVVTYTVIGAFKRIGLMGQAREMEKFLE